MENSPLERSARARAEFRDLQPQVESLLKERLSEPDELEVVAQRDDGAYWFVLGDRRVRMELTTTKQVVVLVYEADAEIRRLPGVMDAPGLAEIVALALTKRV